MEVSIPSVPQKDTPAAPVRRSEPAPKPAAAEPSLLTEAASARVDAQIEQVQNQVLPDKSTVEIDRAAGRFVRTLTDSDTNEVLLRYPSDAQLAFSRAIRAYVTALSR